VGTRAQIKFEREGSEWYAVIPEYPGPKEDLQMILGADHLLYIIAEGASQVELTFDTDPFEGSELLTRKAFGWQGDPEYEGATYWLESYRGLPYGFDLWLCDVTKFVFGDLPQTIYFQ
jgi:hypothetical protein